MSEQPQFPDFEPYEDAAEAAWHRMRQTAARHARVHGTRLPKLPTTPIRRLSSDNEEETKEKKKHFNFPIQATGLDGRAIRRVDRSLPSMGSILKKEVLRRGWETELAHARIISEWEHFVGPALAAHTTVEAIKELTIFVTCDSSTWATSMRTIQRTILQKIAAEVGPNIVEKLNIKGPTAPSWHAGPLRVRGHGPKDNWG
ncbi:MAG: DciA family protein [Corynebacterium sp.]|nr:DciA family protein [Corynebacterium sp.]